MIEIKNEMVENFREYGIYQIEIDNAITGIQPACFIVYSLVPVQSQKPVIVGRVALTYNSVKMPEEIYLMAKHIELSPLLLFYLGFEVSESLPGIDIEGHFVKYLTIKGRPEMIQLIYEKDGSYSSVEVQDDGLFKRTNKLLYLDDLQEYVANKYGYELPIRLEEINHAYLHMAFIDERVNDVVKELNIRGWLSIEDFNKLLRNKPGVLDYDIEPIFKYGLFYKSFRFAPNSFGCFICPIE